MLRLESGYAYLVQERARDVEGLEQQWCSNAAKSNE